MSGVTGLYDLIRAKLPGAELTAGADMSRFTSFRAGGRAALLLNAKDDAEILMATTAAARCGFAHYIIGNGTNLLVSDHGLDALVVRVGERMGSIVPAVDGFEAGAGAPLATLARAAVEAGYMGLEWAAGIPGTVGGAVAMNAGAYGGEIADVLQEATVIEGGALRRVAVQPGDMGYRKSVFRAPERIVVSARFELKRDDGGALSRMKEYAAARREKQPLNFPSAGSTFKRPPGHFAGRLIEEAGLKGVRVGGAQVSELHAGFIINSGDATSADICALIRLVQKRVYETSGIQLETEVLLLGEFD